MAPTELLRIHSPKHADTCTVTFMFFIFIHLLLWYEHPLKFCGMSANLTRKILKFRNCYTESRNQHVRNACSTVFTSPLSNLPKLIRFLVLNAIVHTALPSVKVHLYDMSHNQYTTLSNRYATRHCLSSRATFCYTWYLPLISVTRAFVIPRAGDA